MIFFLVRGQAPPQTGTPRDGNAVNVAVKFYEDNYHYVALILFKGEMGAEAASSATATTADCTTFPATDIGNFDLNFELDSDDDIDDGNADMFMWG